MLYSPESLLFLASTAGIVSLLVALLLVATKRWHGALSMDSNIGVQKFHTDPTPRVGGVSIISGTILAHQLAPAEVKSLLFPMIMAGVPAFAFGLLEDLTKRVGVRTRLLATMACGVLGWAMTGASLTSIQVPGVDWLLGFTVISVGFTAFAVGGVANAVNIIDGFNGLAAGTVIIILASFTLIAVSVRDAPLAGACLVLAGALLGFLLLNWPLGKLFLGDGGAYFVGFAVGWIAVLLQSRHPQLSAWAPMLACAYPLLEVGFSFMRKSKREGHHPAQPDRVHLHMLINRRITRRLFPNTGRTLQNGLTSTGGGAYALFPASWAFVFHNNVPALMFGFVSAVALYWAIYLRLTQFRWCFVIRHNQAVVPLEQRS